MVYCWAGKFKFYFDKVAKPGRTAKRVLLQHRESNAAIDLIKRNGRVNRRQSGIRTKP